MNTELLYNKIKSIPDVIKRLYRKGFNTEQDDTLWTGHLKGGNKNIFTEFKDDTGEANGVRWDEYGNPYIYIPEAE